MKAIYLAIVATLFSVSFANAAEFEGHLNDGFRRPVTCIAKNRRGMEFSARGFNRNFVQQEAMNSCYRVSRFCQPMGCRR